MNLRFSKLKFLTVLIFTIFFLNFNCNILLADGVDGNVLKIAEDIIGLFHESKVYDLSKYIHSKKGVRISPYDDEYNKFPGYLTLNKNQIKNFMKEEKIYTWGFYDGSGDDIKLTPRDYYKRFIYVVDFKNKAKIALFKKPTSKKAQNFKYFFRWFPGSTIVQYNYIGTPKNYHLDFHRLNLVFQKINKKWFLIGIMHGEKTV